MGPRSDIATKVAMPAIRGGTRRCSNLKTHSGNGFGTENPDHAGPEVLRRPGFSAVRSGPTEYLWPGVKGQGRII